jgi:pilus assembly protein CpaB
MQNIQVLSAGQNIQKDAEGKPVSVQVVNLLVTPEQAETLSLASNETKIQLVLRNPLDQQTEKTPGSQMAALFSNPNAPHPAARIRTLVAKAPAPKQPDLPVVPPAPAVFVIEVLNGPKKSEAKFSPSVEDKK